MCSGQERTVTMWKWCKSPILCPALVLAECSPRFPPSSRPPPTERLLLTVNTFLLCRATLKNGKEVCLDPTAPMIKKIVKKILEGYWPAASSVSNHFTVQEGLTVWNLDFVELLSTLKSGYSLILLRNHIVFWEGLVKEWLSKQTTRKMNKPIRNLQFMVYFCKFLAKHWAVCCISSFELFSPNVLCRVFFLSF